MGRGLYIVSMSYPSDSLIEHIKTLELAGNIANIYLEYREYFEIILKNWPLIIFYLKPSLMLAIINYEMMSFLFLTR